MAKITTARKTSKTKRPVAKTAPADKFHRSPVAGTMVNSLKRHSAEFLNRRPHRSFRLTYRRDYQRSLRLPGYFSFTREVTQLLWRNKKTFLLLVALYSLLSAVLVGIASQNTYSQLQDAVSTADQSASLGLGAVGKAGLLAISAVSGGLSSNVGQVQQIYSLFLVLMTWLTTVWLLRVLLAGNKPRLRDAVYSAGAPIMATIVVSLILLIQALPLVAAALIFSVLITSVTGVISMAFAFAAILLVLLSLYWLTSSFMALIIVTLPGMYPWQAIKSAGDLVIGRRIRILLRIVWLLVLVGLLWAITIIPTILFDSWLVKILPVAKNVPLVPVILLLVTTFVTVWVSTYVYLLYRKVVDDGASPA